jgi:hypothetical protein
MRYGFFNSLLEGHPRVPLMGSRSQIVGYDFELSMVTRGMKCTVLGAKRSR